MFVKPELLTWILAGVAGHGAPVAGAGQAVLSVLLPAVHDGC